MKKYILFCVLIGAITLALPLTIMATDHGDGTPDLAVVNMADLHSAYDAYPALLAAAEELVADYGEETQVVYLLNGDLFELGVVVATRSQGAADWEFLRRLGALGTVVFNIGNHEFDFLEVEDFVTTAETAGAIVIGTVGLKGADAPITPTSADIDVNGSIVRIVGVGTDQLNTYPQALRETLEIPEPVGWITDQWDTVTGGADFIIVSTHAGLVADIAIGEAVGPDPRILYALGGHDHLVVRERIAGSTYLHTGFRGERFTVAEVNLQSGRPEITFRDIHAASVAAPDAELATMITRLRQDHLTAEDREVVGIMPDDLCVLEAAMWSVEQVRAYTGADVAFLNHTSFGSGLPAGPLEQYRFDQFMRFDNDVMRATVDAATLRTIIARANQHQAQSLAERTGDFLYAGPVTIRDGERYDIVTSSWVALDFNQMRYLGTTVSFEKVPDITTKGILLKAMGR